MFDMSSFLKENKKVLLVIGASIIAVILTAIGFSIFGNTTDDEDIEETAIGVVDPYSLPKLDSVSVSDQPILYDFLYGSLGLNENLISMVDDGFHFTFISKDGSSRMYAVVNYGHQSDNEIINLLPIFSSAPIKVDLDEVEMNNFKNAISTLANSGVVTAKEGEYTFYAVPSSAAFLGDSLNMIDFDWLSSKNNPGELKTQIIDGMGIPTDIIRKKCDLKAIEKASGIDFNDPFWNKVNYNANIKLFKKDGSDYCIISPIYKPLIAGSGVPLYMFEVNGMDLMMTVQDLNKYLLDNGYESIDEALNNAVYASKNECDEKSDANIVE